MERGGLRGGAGVVASSASDATTVAGVTPTAAGLAILGDANALAQRHSMSANGGGWRTTSSATDTLVGGDGVVEFTVSCIVTLPSAAESGVFVGKTITLIAATAGIVLTLRRAGSDTINGGTSDVVVTMPTARGTLAVVAQSSTAWGSLQPGSLTVNAVYAYFSGGTAYAQSANISPSGTITPISAPVAATAADPTPLGVAGSGANIAFPTAITSPASTVGATATRWTWALSDLGITLPSGPLQTVYNVVTSSMSEGTRGAVSEYVLWGLGTSATAPTSLVGISRPTSGTAWSYAYLVSTSASSVTGAATLTRVSGVRVVGDSTNTDYTLWQYAGSDMTGSASGVSGPSVTTTPTHVGIYAMVGTGTSVGTWTLNAPVFTLRWNVL